MKMNSLSLKINKPVNLGLSILDISEIAIYEHWYDYAKPKYGDNAKLSFIDTASFIVHVKQKMPMKTLLKTLDYEVKRPLPINRKKVIGLMK